MATIARESINQHQECLFPNLHTFQNILMELIREGMLIISHQLQPIYLNLKAQQICQQLWNGSYYLDQLPPILSHISHQLFRNTSSEDISFVMDYQIAGEQTIRIRAYHLTHIVPAQEQKYILVFLEDQNATLEEELQIERKKIQSY